MKGETSFSLASFPNDYPKPPLYSKVMIGFYISNYWLTSVPFKILTCSVYHKTFLTMCKSIDVDQRLKEGKFFQIFAT